MKIEKRYLSFVKGFNKIFYISYQYFQAEDSIPRIDKKQYGCEFLMNQKLSFIMI